MNKNANKKIPNTTFAIGQRVHCTPLGEDGDVAGFENDGYILILDLVRGGTEHVPAGDCLPCEQNGTVPPEELFKQIVRKHLSIDTLETRHRDSLDFHEVSVWQLTKALQAAYEAGRAERINQGD
jgi:hypothetical protein